MFMTLPRERMFMNELKESPLRTASPFRVPGVVPLQDIFQLIRLPSELKEVMVHAFNRKIILRGSPASAALMQYLALVGVSCTGKFCISMVDTTCQYPGRIPSAAEAYTGARSMERSAMMVRFMVQLPNSRCVRSTRIKMRQIQPESGNDLPQGTQVMRWVENQVRSDPPR
jgi:hypothetical protein